MIKIIVPLIISLVFVLDIYWWRMAHLRFKPLKHARFWQWVVGIFTIMMTLLLITRLLPPSWSRRINEHVPLIFIGGQYLWHLSVLPISLAILLGSRFISSGIIRLRSAFRRPSAPLSQAAPAGDGEIKSPTRREILRAASMSIPPLIWGGMVAKSMSQIGSYRVREMDVNLPTLPREFDGLTVAHLSDFHAGQFMTNAMMRDIVSRTNDMQTDLVVITGDLIDYALRDLQPALDALKGLRPKFGLQDGVAMCMGNHDIIENRFTFKSACANNGLPVLANSSRLLNIKGRTLELMAVDWCMTDLMTDNALYETSKTRNADAFQILLAHHPHTFDQAARLNFPLTLSGHTHGGQIMLNPQHGIGSIKFRYLSGLYQKRNDNNNLSQLVVSNGIGNWFPLRINAPAEIVRLTLRRKPDASVQPQ